MKSKLYSMALVAVPVVITLIITSCNSGSSSSNPPEPSPAQQFATVVNNQINLLESSGTTNNPVIVGYAAFPSNGSTTNPQAYLLSYTESYVPYAERPLMPPYGYAIYYALVLSTYSDSQWSSVTIPFSSPNTIVSSLAINNNGIYLVAESTTTVLYLYTDNKLTAIQNPFFSVCNTSCSINSLVSTANSLYVAGSNDNGTQVYQYDGSNWNNLMNIPTSQVVVSSLAVDNSGNVYASGIESNTRGYLAKYVNGNWQRLTPAIESSYEQSIVFNGSNLFNLAVASGNNYPYYLYKQTNNIWNQVATMTDNGFAELSFGQLSSDLYGNIYFNGTTSPVKSYRYKEPMTELIYINQ